MVCILSYRLQQKSKNWLLNFQINETSIWGTTRWHLVSYNFYHLWSRFGRVIPHSLASIPMQRTPAQAAKTV